VNYKTQNNLRYTVTLGCGDTNMKLGIPTNGTKGLDEQVGEHFGRVPTYTVVNQDNGEITVLKNTSAHMGGIRQPPELLADEGVHILICKGLGRRAIDLFETYGIEVYIGATGTVQQAITDYTNGKLQKATSEHACQQHAFRNQHHHD